MVSIVQTLRTSVLFVIFFFPALASDITGGSKTEALFWKVESESATVYMLGSIHIASDDLYPLPFHIENAFNKSGYLVVEDFLYDLTLPRERIRDLFDAYKRWDAAWIRDFIFESVGKHPELQPLYEKLLDDRNVNMAEKIDSFLRNEGTYFVVVGAGHLFGEMGIIELLRKKGYTPVVP